MNFMMNKNIDFIGVGAPRCGTTWIAECLMQHPEIGFPETKELNYFSKTRANGKSDYDLNGIDKYLKIFEKCKNKKIVGEYSTYYMVDLNVARIIKKHFPNVKIIICLREPVERAFSDWKNRKFSHLTEKRNFETAFFEENGLDSYKERGMYHKQIKNYLELFPKKNIQIILMEEIEKNPEKVIRGLYKFLGINEKFIPINLHKKTNESKKTKNKFLRKFFKLSSVIYRKLEQTFIGKFLTYLKRKTNANEILWKIDQKNKLENIKEKLSPELKTKLKKVYLEDIKKLEKLIDRDLGSWKN